MSLMDAPNYDPTHDNRVRNIGVGVAITLALLLVLTLAGYFAGHGWLFSNLGYEHKVDKFFTALEQRDYPKAFGIYNNDPDWQQHPEKYSDYPLARFTDDWTVHSPAHDPIFAHHVDVSRTDGKGNFGTGVIVAVKVNHTRELFMYVIRKDGTMTWPAPHELTRY